MATQRAQMMKDESFLREHLLLALTGDGAHVDFETATREVPAQAHGRKPEGAEHTLWQLLEHLRICQRDVLEGIRNPKHVSPDDTEGYWPATSSPQDKDAWQKSIAGFRADMAALRAIVEDAFIGLSAPLHGNPERTIARRVLMLAYHNSYHLGQLVLVRRLLGEWPPAP